MRALTLMTSLLMLVTSARSLEQMAGLDLLDHSTSDHFSGKFCFTLEHDVSQWRLSIEFSSPVRDAKAPDGVWSELTPPAGQCATIWTMANLPSAGVHSAGQTFCIRVTGGAVCKGGQPDARATLTAIPVTLG